LSEQTIIDRAALLDWLLPHCEPGSACILYPQGKDEGPGWANGTEDVTRAVNAWRERTLERESFDSVTRDGRAYRITGGLRLGLVPHRDGLVARFCLDYDGHEGQTGNVHLADAVDRFLGAQAVRFTSRSGCGLHGFYGLAEPVTVETFLSWTKAWGFNRRGDIECFPKTEKLSMVLLPNAPNDKGGDSYRQGTFESCAVKTLPAMPSKPLNKETLDFLRGFVARGYRNEALNAAAFYMAKKHMPESEVHALCMRGADLCGLLAEEPEKTKSTLESGFRAGQQEVSERPAKATADPNARTEVLRGLACTDYGNAQRLVKHHGADLRYCHSFGHWLTWTGTHWTPDPAVAEQRAKDTVMKLYDGVRDLPDPQDREAFLEHAVRSESATRIAAMLSLARSEPGVPIGPDDLDRDLWLLNCLNGVVDLRAGELRPHRRDDLITRLAPVAYEPLADCARWRTFLERIMDGNADLMAFLRRAVGYSLTGSTSERCIFILHGTGKNGKSVFTEAVRMLLGDGYAARTPTQTLMAKRGEVIPNDVARLKGVRFVSASETGEGKTFDEAVVKELTGGDRVSARFMRGEWFEFTPQFKIFLSTNHKPRILGRDEAIWDRIRLVPFNVRIPDHERKPMDELLAGFRAELSGILAWAVRGCLEWQRDGLGAPLEVMQATTDYKDEMDILGDFIEECCRMEPASNATSGELYEAYRAWALTTGERVMPLRAFSLRMSERGAVEGFEKRHARQGKVWSGIGLTCDISALAGSVTDR
jgi:P4 family phage/plasmid primase-like protien